MKHSLAIITLISIAAFAGNMINIGFSYAGYWLSLEPLAFMEDFKVKFPLLLLPTSVTLLPAFVGSLLLFLRNRQNPGARTPWLYAFVGVMLTIVLTLVYHLPTNLAFMDIAFEPEVATTRLHLWVGLHWVRVLGALGAAYFAIRGFQKNLEA